MILKTWLLVVLGACVQQVQLVDGNFQCYQCKDCARILYVHLQTCYEEATAPTTSTEATTTEAMTTTTTRRPVYPPTAPPIPPVLNTTTVSSSSSTTTANVLLGDSGISKSSDSRFHFICFYEEVMDARDKITVNRGCTTDRNYCYSVKGCCWTCTTDECNSGVIAGASIFLLLVTIYVDIYFSPFC